jgi:hypothetical protein
MRGGKIPESLFKYHISLLRMQWWRLDDAALVIYLRRIVSAEYQRHAKIIVGVRYLPDPRLQPQLRWRRIKIAKRLLESGANISTDLLKYNLHRNWQGTAYYFNKVTACSLIGNENKGAKTKETKGQTKGPE